MLDQVRQLFEEAEVTIPGAVLDRAHCVSKNNHDVTVRFASFCHRTLFYRKCKTLKGKSVHLDLTKSWLKLLNNANNLISSRSDIAFCCADKNCRCKVRFSDGKELFFKSISDLEDILDDSENKLFIFTVFILFCKHVFLKHLLHLRMLLTSDSSEPYFWIYSCLQTGRQDTVYYGKNDKMKKSTDQNISCWGQ